MSIAQSSAPSAGPARRALAGSTGTPAGISEALIKRDLSGAIRAGPDAPLIVYPRSESPELTRLIPVLAKGRLSRALPLLLTEHLSLHSSARAITLSARSSLLIRNDSDLRVGTAGRGRGGRRERRRDGAADVRARADDVLRRRDLRRARDR